MLKTGTNVNDVIASFRDFGRLVKSWATEKDDFTGKDYSAATWRLELHPHSVTSNTDSTVTANIKALLMTGDAFKKKLEEANNERQFLTDLSKVALPARVVIVQDEQDTMIIRLPLKQTILEAEKDYKNPEPVYKYQIPGFYDALYKNPNFTRNSARQLMPTTLDGRLDLQACRIGDYTIGNCN